jgi:hypothetical protein
MLCLIADIKTRLGLTGTEHDTLLAALVAAFSRRADVFTARVLQDTGANVTEYHQGGCQYLQLERYPVVSITTIKESWDFDWTAATALVADTDYRLLAGGRTGLLLRLYADWIDQPDGIQVVYRGGFAEPDAVLTAGQTALPPDLREAAIEQCSLIFKRRDDIGLSGITFEGGGFQKFSAIDLLPNVEKTLLSYRRLSV